MKDMLRPLIAQGGNLVNIGRNLKTNYPSLHNKIINATTFLPNDCKFNERLYCVMNDITERKKCPLSNVDLRFINYQRGYASTNKNAKVAEVKLNPDPISTEEFDYLEDNDADIANNPQYLARLNNALYGKVLYQTQFLDAAAGFSERLYCLLNGITTRQLTNFKTYSSGYRDGIRLSDAEYLEFAKVVGSQSLEHGKLVYSRIVKHQQRNADLYALPDSEINKSFVECPILGIRKLNIKEPYVNNILLMTMDEFQTRFPNQLLSCERHRDAISTGIQKEVAPGITIHQQTVEKSRVTLSTVGEDNLTGDERRGLKVRSTHLANVDENGLNGYQHIAEVARPKQIITMGKNHEALEDPKWIMYKNFCYWWSSQFREPLLDGKKTGRMGAADAYQVDHVYSIWDAFQNQVSPFVVADATNMEVVTWQDNASKQANSGQSLTDLLNRCNYTTQRSRKEFDIFMDIIATATHMPVSSYLLSEFNLRAGIDARIFNKQKI